jgi:hypothetical protein
MGDFILFSTIFTVISNFVLIIFRNFEWSTTKFKLITYCCITLINIIFYFVEEFSVTHPQFYVFIGFSISPIIVLSIDLILRKISLLEYGRDFDFIMESTNKSYFGDRYSYTLLDKGFSVILILAGLGLPIFMATKLGLY